MHPPLSSSAATCTPPLNYAAPRSCNCRRHRPARPASVPPPLPRTKNHPPRPRIALGSCADAAAPADSEAESSTVTHFAMAMMELASALGFGIAAAGAFLTDTTAIGAGAGGFALLCLISAGRNLRHAAAEDLSRRRRSLHCPPSPAGDETFHRPLPEPSQQQR